MLSLDWVNQTILVSTALIFAAVLTSLLALRLGAPLLLLFLGVGMAAGIDLIRFDNANAAFFIGSVALALILFESGFNTRWKSYKVAALPALSLATVGTVITAGIVAAAGHYLLEMSWPISILLGAIVSSTDAAAVTLLLRVGGITLRNRVRATLEIESGTNDPTAILLTILAVQYVMSGTPDFGFHAAQEFFTEMLLGGLIGVVGGHAIASLLNRLQLDTGLYPVLALTLALFLFAFTGTLGGSGFLAIYLAGFIVGNRNVKGAIGLRRFQDGIIWLAQIVMFILLGLFVDVDTLLPTLVPALILTLVLVVVARPLAVWLCLKPFRFSWREKFFIGWVGLRGAVSILLALLPLTAGIPEAQQIFALTFMIVVLSVLLQGWVVAPLASALHLVVPDSRGPVDRLELDLPLLQAHELVSYKVHESSPVLVGRKTLPPWAKIVFITRAEKMLEDRSLEEIRMGDQVYFFLEAYRIPQLDTYFAERREENPAEGRQFYGDLQMPATTTLAALTKTYGVSIAKDRQSWTLAQLFAKEYPDGFEPGDRLKFASLEVIAREVDEIGVLQSAGIAFEPLLLSRTPKQFLQRLLRGRRRKSD